MARIALIDDYQSVALEIADWASLGSDHSVEVFHDHLDDETALAERLQPFEIVMALRERTPFTRSLIERLPNLGLIATAGMRNAAIDLDAARDHGVVVSGTPGLPYATAELTWGLLLCLARQITHEHNATRDGSWQETLGFEVNGMTLGVIGLGKLGGHVANIAQAFKMNVIAWSQNMTEERAAEYGATLVSKETLLEQSDFISIHLVLSERTRDLIGSDDLARMKSTAYVINTSRGPIINEAALIDALSNGTIAGAGLDTFDVEPLPADHPFRKLSNVVVSPHMGYVTRQTYEVFYGETLNNIKAFLAGEPIRVLT
jgi:phosphoglycerate dehydrogenase-like enzyme